jgi:redox-sensitive bicupin YhaK (pirin superfamily)
MHSEFNHAGAEETHFFQIWIEPNVTGISPSYEQKTVPTSEKQGVLKLVAAPTGEEASISLHADARIYAGLLGGSDSATVSLDPKRKAYVHLVRGSLSVNGQKLQGGDAAKIQGESLLSFSAANDAEVLVFDLAA